MSRTSEKALLPAGLRDVLPPDAAYEADTVERLIAVFSARGYERVKPPLLEFEEALLSGAGAALSQQTFRLMDPVSQRMLALRADMTTQVARIAGYRLAKVPRPLRLCYAGQVLRVKGSQLRAERQFAQVGAELIGTDAEAADAEAVSMAVEALQSVGLQRLSVDLNLPPLVGALAAELGLDPELTAELRQALDRKDAAAVETLAGAHAKLFLGLLQAAGPADEALARLERLALPADVAAGAGRLARVTVLLRAALPDLTLTVDPVEHRGFEYQTGVSFTIYARGVRGEIGRGGRYTTGDDGAEEPATGFTLFMDSVMRAMPPAPPGQRVYLPAGTPHDEARALRADGWVTLAGLESAADSAAEARRLGCAHLWQDGRVVELD
ncbi:ATP phosphoribosyltransferase regulatory subunit [Ferruginivarius sediminum]|uniref:ATP phosphoribosyltransferase regulatory subunit n=1 Tax=Ferruginivarius sediminum TaxID=2661937 RepID=A0A369T9J3_9PROT|nr:ATP phosphoribosyltransferase regulatory subunit [Ferruginivarius sediminum]RDD61958.1 ATP phosphoribosyltransferase regulatory subunit [Ferruginivarius sediminum]